MQKLIVQVAAKASLKHCVPPSLPLPVSVKHGVVFHLAKGDSVNEAGELLWVVKEAYIVFSPPPSAAGACFVVSLAL